MKEHGTYLKERVLFMLQIAALCDYKRIESEYSHEKHF
jgi:hypothetical protein